MSEPKKRVSMRAAINAKCRECIYDPHGSAGTWRQQVEACTSTDCALYPLRPRSRGEKVQDGAKKADFPTATALTR